MGILDALKKTIVSMFAYPLKPKKRKKKSLKPARCKKKKAKIKRVISKKNTSKTKPAKIKARLQPQNSKVIKREAAKNKPTKNALASEEVATVTHYFPKVKAAAIRIHAGKEVRLGDTLEFQSLDAKFVQKVISLQINRIPIEVARPSEEVGLMVKKPVKEGDKVYRK